MTLALYLLLCYYILTPARATRRNDAEYCPPSWPGTQVDEGEEIKLSQNSQYLVSYGRNGNFVIIVVQNKASVPRSLICDESLATGGSEPFFPTTDSDVNIKCCSVHYKPLKNPFRINNKEHQYWKPMEMYNNVATHHYKTPHFIEFEYKDAVSIYGVTTKNIYCHPDTFGKIKKLKMFRDKYQCRVDQDSEVKVKHLVQCNMEDATVCDFKYKDHPTWIAYGNPDENNLIFKTIVSKTGKIPCHRIDKNNNCYVAANSRDMEPHFGVWRMKGQCDGCKEFWYQLDIGVALGRTNTETNLKKKQILFKPSILGNDLFDLGATTSSTITVNTQKIHKQNEVFTFICDGINDFIFQRQLIVYHMTVDGVYQGIEVKLPIARCHADPDKPPVCAAGKCGDNETDRTCQTNKCIDMALNIPPNTIGNDILFL